MKLVELECQNCGAALKIEKGKDTITCPYCNATYKIDEEQKGNIEKEKNNNHNNQDTSKDIIKAVMIPIVIISAMIMTGTILSFVIFGAIGLSTGSKHYSKYEISNFNSSYSNGKQAEVFIESMLNKAITTNKTNKEKNITVKYNDMETKEPEGILRILNQLNRFERYNVLLDYDDDGFVNKITIE